MIERNRPDDTFGWGVVFSDATLGNFQQADPRDATPRSCATSTTGTTSTSSSRARRSPPAATASAASRRKKLLNILQARAAELGVEAGVPDRGRRTTAPFADADLIVAADGVNSVVRRKYAEHFQPDIDVRKCRYIWLGSHRKLDAFTFAFEETPWGWFQLHAYRFDATPAPSSSRRARRPGSRPGWTRPTRTARSPSARSVFGKYLDGHRLMSNARHLRGSAWLNFNRVLCEKWHHRNIVLIGDAAHTAHFSIGSGTKLAMEDAIALVAHAVASRPMSTRALELYQEERSVEALRLQSAARNRMEWFENVARYVHLDPVQFSYTLLTGSQRIGHENLRLRDSRYVERVETLGRARRAACRRSRCRRCSRRSGCAGSTLKNRVVVSPMAMYSCRGRRARRFLSGAPGLRARWAAPGWCSPR